MIPQHALHILQTGLKYLFDIDPSLTDHLFRHMLGQAAVISDSAGMMLRNYSDKFANVMEPVMQDLRIIRLSSAEL